MYQWFRATDEQKFSVYPLDLEDQGANQGNWSDQTPSLHALETEFTVCVLPLYFLAEGMRVSLVSISSSSEILSTVVRYSITLVNRSGRLEISKMCSMYDRLSAWDVLFRQLVHS